MAIGKELLTRELLEKASLRPSKTLSFLQQNCKNEKSFERVGEIFYKSSPILATL